MKLLWRERIRNSGGARTVPYQVLGLGLLLTALAWVLAARLAAENDRTRLREQAAKFEALLSQRVEARLLLLRAGAGLFDTGADVSAASYRNFVRRLATTDRALVLPTLRVSVRVANADIPGVERWAARAGVPNLHLHPVPGEAYTHGILFTESLSPNAQEVIGRNMHADKTRAVAMDAAEVSGKIVSTAPLILNVDQPHQRYSYLWFQPVYQGAGVPATEDQRHRLLRGFVFTSFRISPTFSRLTELSPDLNVAFWGQDPNGDRRQLYPTASPANGGGNPSVTRHMTVLGQKWTVRCRPTPHFYASSFSRFVPAVPIAGVLISGLLFLLTRSQSRQQMETERAAAEGLRREAGLRLLADAGYLIAASTTTAGTLTRLADLVVPRFADWCAIHLLGEDGQFERAALAHIDPERLRMAEETLDHYPPDVHVPQGMMQALQTGKGQLYATISGALLDDMAQSAEHRRILEAMNFSSAMLMPMVTRGKPLGVMTFVWAESGFRYNTDDMRLAQEIADRAAAAVDNARLSRSEEQESRIATALEEAGRALSAELDPERLVQFVTDRATELTGAQYGAFFYGHSLGELQELTLYALSGERREEFAAMGVSRATQIFGPSLNHGETLRIADVREDSRYGPVSSPLSVPSDQLPVVSYLSVPVVSREKTIGILLFAHDEPSHFTEREERIAQGLAAHAAVALDNARLFAEVNAEVEERRRAEGQVRELNENLERLVEERTRELSNANAELESFAYSVAHDLRTPLRSLDGFSKALLEDYGTQIDESGRGYLERIRNGTRRMDELITALLTLSRLTRTEMHPEPVDLTAIAEAAARDMGDEGQARIEVQPDLRGFADPRMMRALFDNLIGNAVKFSAYVESPHIQVGQANSAFFVRDNGAGFNPEYKSRLFRPFERLHTAKEFPGSGIGLATVERIVRRHGGSVWAESEIGRGATFFFTLPG